MPQTRARSGAGNGETGRLVPHFPVHLRGHAAHVDWSLTGLRARLTGMPDEPSCLADGSQPATPDDLFQRLQALGIATTTVRHPPVFTVEEAKLHRGHIPGVHTKNLFLRNKKDQMWLVVCHQDRTVDLRRLGPALGSSSRLSFGSPQRLMRYLGVIPGAVNPFAVINDHQNAVRLVVDSAILGEEPLNFHPLDNAQTTSITPEDFLRFLKAEEHPPTLISLGA